MYSLRKLHQAQLPQKLLINFYGSIIESLLAYWCNWHFTNTPQRHLYWQTSAGSQYYHQRPLN